MPLLPIGALEIDEGPGLPAYACIHACRRQAAAPPAALDAGMIRLP